MNFQPFFLSFYVVVCIDKLSHSGFLDELFHIFPAMLIIR